MLRRTFLTAGKTLLVLTLFCTPLLPGAARAADKAPPADAMAPLADRVPADAIAYFGWRGAAGLKGQYAKSNLAPLVAATNFNELEDPFIPELLKRLETQNKKAAEIARTVLAIAEPMWNHPSAFYFSGIDLKEGGQVSAVRMAMICRAGKDAADLQTRLEAAIEHANQMAEHHLGVGAATRPSSPWALHAGKKGDMVTITLGSYEYHRPGKNAGSLATEPAFLAALAQVGKQPAIVGYMNFDGLMKLADSAVDRFGGDEGKTSWPKVRATLGLDGLHSAVFTGGFDGKGWLEEGFVAAPMPRRGLLAMPDETPVSKEALTMVPQSATMVTIAHIDLPKILDIARKSADELKPGTSDMITGVLQQATQMSGIDVENDLFAGLGDEWISYADPLTGGKGLSGTVLVNRLRNAEKAERALTAMEKFAQSTADTMLADKKIHLSFQMTERGDLKIHYLATPLLTPAWTIHNGNLYVAFFPQVVATAAGRAPGGKGKSIMDNLNFSAFQKEIGVGQPTTIQFMDLRRTAPDSYGQWLMISHLSGFADIFGVKSPAMLLPPLNTIMTHLTPAGSVTWADKDGFHMKGISPFPGATLLASSPFDMMTGGNPAAMIGMMMPAMFKSHEARQAGEKHESTEENLGLQKSPAP